MDYLQITKDEFKAAWKLYKGADEFTKTFAFTRARVLMELLEKFGLDHMDIEALQNEAKI